MSAPDPRPPRPPASFSLPRQQIDQLDALAAEHNVPRSRVLEGLISSALATPATTSDGDASQPEQPAAPAPVGPRMVRQPTPALLPPVAPSSSQAAFLSGFELGLRRGIACPSGACPPIAAEDFDLDGAEHDSTDEELANAHDRLRGDDLDGSDD